MYQYFTTSLKLLSFLVLLIVVVACGENPNSSSSSKDSSDASDRALKVVTIGSIGSNVASEIDEFHPIAEYLSDALESEGIQVKATAAQSVSDAVTMLEGGALDILVDSPYSVYAIDEKVSLKVMARRWKKGAPEYSSVIYVRRDSEIENLKDLRGKLIGFEEPFSTSSFLLPSAHIVNEGLPLKQVSQPGEPINSETIGFTFTDDDETTLMWVIGGKMDAGCTNNIDFENIAKGAENSLRILSTTRSVPRHLVANRATLDPTVAKAIADALLEMHKSPEGRVALERFSRTSRFDICPGESELRQNIKGDLRQVPITN